MIKMSINSAKRLGIAKTYLFKEKAIPVIYFNEKTNTKKRKSSKDTIKFKQTKNVYSLVGLSFEK